MKKALFPGSFDPITLGHLDIIKRSLPIFDEVTIAIGTNSNKNYMFSLKRRKEWIEKIFRNEKKINVCSYDGLTVSFCKKINCQFILRGLRNPADFEFEKAIAHTNRTISKIETIFLLTSSETSFISSSIVRDVIRNKGQIKNLVPAEVDIMN